MRVFVLGTGRCGTFTFALACLAMENYTSGHETILLRQGDWLSYPDNHIECDTKMSWFLGTLDKKYGDSPLYVHLTRNRALVAESYMRQYNRLMQRGNDTSGMGWVDMFCRGILQSDMSTIDPYLSMVDAMNENIRLFMRDKSNVMNIQIENIQEQFPRFWERIGAVGDLPLAMQAVGIRNNRWPQEAHSIGGVDLPLDKKTRAFGSSPL